MEPVRRAAPAKLNLYLHVLGRRADGYHLLDSLVAFADIADVVTARAAPALDLEISGPFAGALPRDHSENLVWRAAALLAARIGRAPEVAFALEKNLPPASGIGGGSSDAAATLRALAEMWELDLGAARFEGLAAALGADVPVCLLGRTAWLGGIGEAVEAAPSLPDCFVVLVNPGVAVSTPAVFRARSGPFSMPARFDARPADAAVLAALLAARRNDLMQPALALVPEISLVLAALEAQAGALLVRMSGSGATCFALFATESAARDAARRLAAAHPGWWIAAGRLL